MNFSVEKFKDLEGCLENLSFEESPSIEERNPSIQVEKLSIEKLKKTFLNKNLCKSTEENILIVYDNIDTNQIFGAPEIERIEE